MTPKTGKYAKIENLEKLCGKLDLNFRALLSFQKLTKENIFGMTQREK